MITLEDFNKIDLRAGTIVQSEIFPEAKNPAFILWIYLGPELGTRTQITQHYQPTELNGLIVVSTVTGKVPDGSRLF
jgi:tRNA-binding protein